MQLLLNTIMLEVNRWTADKALTQPLAELLPAIRAAGFDALEIWQYYISRLDDDEFADLKSRLDDHALQTVAVGAYPPLHLDGGAGEVAAAELERIVARAATLGATTLKIFPGASPVRLPTTPSGTAPSTACAPSQRALATAAWI